LVVDGVSRRFGGLTAVADVTMELRRGEVLGLIGPNGSGKSTLLSLISGQRRPSAGRIRLDGREVTRHGAARICRAGVACTFQLVHLPDSLSALDNVAVAAMYGRRRLGVAEARAVALELLRQVHFAADPEAGAGQLTYFDQKRVELARALATEPEILLLDEWLAGLTPTELNDAISLIRALHASRDLSIVLVEHVMTAIRELCERIVVLNAGEVIAEGTTEECLANPEVVAVYLGEDDA
jgi:branched-chain amino acid transport system ATP-binding protein